MKYMMLLLIMMGVVLLAFFYSIKFQKNKLMLRIFYYRSSKKIGYSKEDVVYKRRKLYNKLCLEMDREKLYTLNLSREKLAKILNTNTTYLSEAIKMNEDGITVSQFINNYRLKYAAKLLIEKQDLCVEAVGEYAGFHSRSTFFRQFRDYYGISPRNYRISFLKKARNKKKCHF